MEYYWPKLSEKGIDLGFLRIGYAHGLGNLLNAWARCIVYAYSQNQPQNIIAPTWTQFSPNQWMHGDKDKRIYHDLFDNSIYINSLKKIKLLSTLPKIEVSESCEAKDFIRVFTIDNKSSFHELLYHHNLIFSELQKISKEKNRGGLKFDFSNSLSVHIRFGDFLRLNRATDLSFFIDLITQIRKEFNYELKVYVFSDATDLQLASLLDLNNVERLFFGNSLADMLAMSKSKILIASQGSTFSKWASFLGRMPVIYPARNWIKLYYENPDAEIVMTPNERIPKSFLYQIEKVNTL